MSPETDRDVRARVRSWRDRGVREISAPRCDVADTGNFRIGLSNEGHRYAVESVYCNINIIILQVSIDRVYEVW